VVTRHSAAHRERRLARQHRALAGPFRQCFDVTVLRTARTADFDRRRRRDGGTDGGDTRHHVALSSQRYLVRSLWRTDGRQHSVVVATTPCALSRGPDQSSGLRAASSNQRLAVIRRLGGVRDRPILRLYLGTGFLLRTAACAGVGE